MSALIDQFARLRGILRRRGQSQENAEDLVQEAFLRLYEFQQSGRDVIKPEAFVVRAAFNLAVDAGRKKSRDLTVGESVEELQLPDLSPSPEERLATDQRLATARRILNSQMAFRTREIFVLHRVEGLKQAEIALRLGISVSAVEKHIARAVLVLMEGLKDS